jgi:hypothetical protein
LTLDKILKQDANDRASDRMPIEVRDWISRFVAGTPVPPVSIGSNNPDSYREIAWVEAVLNDKYIADNALPNAAIELVQNYLRELEEETDLHIWNEGAIARTALPLMIGLTSQTDASDAFAVVKAAFAMHCAKKEVSDFLTRSGLRDSRYADPEWEKEQLAKAVDYDAATAANHLLADPDLAAADYNELARAIMEFGDSTEVHTNHPALVESALFIMFEAMRKPIKGKNKKFLTEQRQREYDTLHAVIKKLKAKKEAAKK